MNGIPLWIYLKRYFRPDTDETTSTFMCDSYLKQENNISTLSMDISKFLRLTCITKLDYKAQPIGCPMELWVVPNCHQA